MTGHRVRPALLAAQLCGDGVPTPRLSDSSLAVHDAVAGFVRRTVRSEQAIRDSGDLSGLPALVRSAGAVGITGAALPTAHGGLGLATLDALVVAHALGGCPAFAVTVGAHAGLAGTAIALGGDDAQRARWLPGIADGSQIGCYALTEPNAGSDALALQSVAIRDGEDWVLTGSKQFITNAGFADLAVVFALADGSAFSAFVVPMQADGVMLGPEERKLGLHGSSTRALHLDGVRVPASHLLGQAGRGHRTAFAVLTLGRLRLAAGACGEARHLLDVIIRHCRARSQFGRPLAAFGITRRKVAELAAELLAIEAAVWDCGRRLDAALAAAARDAAARDRRVPIRIMEFDVDAALCKVLASEHVARVADEAVQLLGGYGYMEDGPTARAYRDARIHRIYEGTNEICRLMVAPILVRRGVPGAVVTHGDTWEQSCAHAITEATWEAVRIAADREDQAVAEIVADCAADAMKLRALLRAPPDPLVTLALPLLMRSCLAATWVRLGRIAPLSSPSLTRAHALLAEAPDGLALADELGRRVLSGEALRL